MSRCELRRNPSSEEMLVQCKPILDDVEFVIQTAVHSSRQAIYRDGVLDTNRFDRFQSRCFAMAIAKAELEAARALLNHARSSDDELIKACAVFFCAESVKSVLGNYVSDGHVSGGHALGVVRQQVAQLLASEAVTGWLDWAGDGEALAAHCIETGLSRLPCGLTEEQELVRNSFGRFADEVVAPLAEEIHRQDKDIPEAIIKSAAELGCFGICIPERFGGLQADDRPDSLGMIIVTEELSRGSLGAAGSLITRPEIAARALLAGGTEAQQQKWLPQLASGAMLCAISITEPNTGSDVAAVSLRATATEDGWLLNGSKTWCTFAGRSELLVVLARTDNDPASGHKGLSLFLIHKPACSGYEFAHQQEQGGTLTGRGIATLGYRGMHSYELFFDNYFVPAENLVGEKQGEGKGFYYTMAGFAGGRLQTAARATGLMQAAFEQALGYSCDRHVFNQPLAQFELTQKKLSCMLATITAARQFSFAVARKIDNGEGQMEASLVKLFSCRVAEWVTREAMQIHGGMGYAEESAVSRYFVDARVLSIFEGAEEVLAIRVIAREMMERHDHDAFERELLARRDNDSVAEKKDP